MTTDTLLCNVGYLGGTHGAFLTYFIDRQSRHTPDIIGTPFLKTGTSHSEDIQYSNRVTRCSFEDPDGNWRDEVNFNQKNVIIILDKEALLTFSRLQFLRPFDHETTSTHIKLIDNRFHVNHTFKNFYAQDFLWMYDIDIGNENIPIQIMRDYLKIIFLNDDKNRWLTSSNKVKNMLDEKNLPINLSDLYDTKKFMSRMQKISDGLNLDLDLGKSAHDIHKQFLQKLYIDNTTLQRADIIIKNVIENKPYKITCGNLDIVEQGYIFANIEKNFEFIQCPLIEDFFKDTDEIKNYIKNYPNHYKAMNPNLPKFNGIDNPYYLHKNKK